jgi:hypothetical protein
MITEVVAFEVPAKGKNGERVYINNLRRNLDKIGIPNTTYYGSFEEVVLLGEDFDGQKYSQTNVITLYNLDFCGEIGSKIISSEGENLYRLEAIRQVIRNQVACFNRLHDPSSFIILLTVRNQMHSRVLKERLIACRQLWAGFITTCEAIMPVTGEDNYLIGTHAWALKTIIHTVFNECLRGNNISSLFFPLVKYEGSKKRISRTEIIPSPMLHLMIFCKFQPQQEAVGVSLPLNPLLTKSLVVCDESLAAAPEPGETVDSHLSSVEYFETLKAEILE